MDADQVKSVAIIGAGISGLVVAYELQLLGHHVDIFEKSDRIGGKIYTHSLNGTGYDLGAIICSISNDQYLNVKGACEQFHLTVEARPFSQHQLCDDFVNKIPAIHYEAFKESIGFGNLLRSFEFSDSQILSSVTQPLPQYCEQNHLSTSSLASLTYFRCGYGFIDDSSIPAIHYLRFNADTQAKDLQFFSQLSSVPNCVVKGGYQQLPLKLADWLLSKGFSIHLNAAIKRIDRDDLTVSIECHDGTKRMYDRLIISCPSKEIFEALGNPSQQETRLLSSINYINYSSLLIEFNFLPEITPKRKEFIGSYFAKPARKDHFIQFEIFDPSKPNIAILYIYESSLMTQKELLRGIELDFQDLFQNSDIFISCVHAYKNWSNYMPHFSNEDTQLGRLYEIFESIQGQNKTYYCGSLFNGEMVESNIAYSRNLVHKYFEISKQIPPSNVFRLLDIRFKECIKSEETFLHTLKKWSQIQPEEIAFQWFEKGEKKSMISYNQMWQTVSLYAGQLLQSGLSKGKLVMLLFEPGMEFFLLFYACLYVGIIALPYFPPNPGSPQKGIDLVETVLTSSGCTCVLLSEKIRKLKLLRGNWPKEINSHSVSYLTLQLPGKGDKSAARSFADCLALPSGKDIAFLQYTSGSTGQPKGVIVGHDNFQAHNCRAAFFNVTNQFGGNIFGSSDNVTKVKRRSICTSWLPQYHDMGLALAAAATLYDGGLVALMSPFDFLRDPLVWFDVMSLTKSTHSVAPNFAYGLVTRKWDSSRARKWDLSHLKVLGNSAEPVLESTISAFKKKIKFDVPSCSIDTICLPGYGMAECVAYIGSLLPESQLVKTETHFQSQGNGDTVLIASIPNCHQFGGIAIVSPETGLICCEDAEGEIWLSNPSIARGYWNQPLLTKVTFQNRLSSWRRPWVNSNSKTLLAVTHECQNEDSFWLRTGDLGFIRNGHLFITGRLKDLIIVNGRNLYPQDIESVVQEADIGNAIRPGCIIAFSYSLEHTEGFVIIVELRSSFLSSLSQAALTDSLSKELGPSIINHVSNRFPGDIVEIVFIKERTIPKTTSGKLRRFEAKKQWLENSLSVVFRFQEHKKFSIVPHNKPQFGTHLPTVNNLQWADPIVEEILNTLAQRSNTHISSMMRVQYTKQCKQILQNFSVTDGNISLIQLGIDSLKLSELVQTLSHPIFVDDKLKPSLRDIEFNTFFQWTGNDLVSALFGIFPEMDRNVVIFPLSSEIKPELPNLFLFHQLFGYSTDYKLLKSSLSSHYNVYCINSPNLCAGKESKSFYAENLTVLMRWYLKLIKQVQSIGPYHFGGSCFGGLIAIEMTRLLQQASEEVHSLILISYYFHSLYREPSIRETFDLIYETFLPDIGMFGVKKNEKIKENGFHALKLSEEVNYFTTKMKCDNNSSYLSIIPKVIIVNDIVNFSAVVCNEASSLSWNYTDCFGGIANFLRPDQKFHFDLCFTDHVHFFTGVNKDSINKIISNLLNENDTESFSLRDSYHNVSTILSSKADTNTLFIAFFLKHYIMQNIEEDLINMKISYYHHLFNPNKEAKSLLLTALERNWIDLANFCFQNCNLSTATVEEAVHYGQNFRPDLKIYRMISAFHIDIVGSGIEDLEGFSKSDVVIESQVINIATIAYKEKRSVEITELFRTCQNKLLDSAFVWQSLISLSKQIPTFLLIALFTLCPKLLVFRLLSTSSLPTLAAYILDEGVWNVFLVLIQQICLPLLHYVNRGAAQNRPDNISAAVIAVVYLIVLIGIIPLFVYSSIVPEISVHITGTDSSLTNEWSSLAAFHMISIVPCAFSLCLESICSICYSRSIIAIGTLLDGLSFLLAAYIFARDGNDNLLIRGSELGISLGIGSWVKFCFYCLYFHHSDLRMLFGDDWTRKDLFPYRTIKQIANELFTKVYCYSSIFSVSHMLVVFLLVSSTANTNEGMYNVIVFGIGSCLLQIVSLPSNAIGQAATLLNLRMTSFHYLQMKNGFLVRLLSLLTSLSFSIVLAIPFFILSGKEITSFLMDTSSKNSSSSSLFLPGGFYEKLENILPYFLAIGLLRSLIQPLYHFLFSTLSFQSICVSQLIIFFVIGNIVAIASFLLNQDNQHFQNSDLMKESFGLTVIVCIWLLYEWFREVSYQIHCELYGKDYPQKELIRLNEMKTIHLNGI